MANLITISIDKAKWDSVISSLRGAPKKLERAAIRAANRAGEHGYTQTKRIVAKELGLKQADLTKPHRFGAQKGQSTGQALRLHKSNDANVPVRITIAGGRIPLIYFGAKEVPGKWITRGRGKKKRRLFVRTLGVTYKIGRQGTKKIKDAFIGKTKSGHEGVWRQDIAAAGSSGTYPGKTFGRMVNRKRAGRLPIWEPKGISVPVAAQRNAEFSRLLKVDLGDVMLKRMQHEVQRIIRKGGAPNA